MAYLSMEGPYELTTEKIDAKITRTSAGNYALGTVSDNTYYPHYVGRSDDDVNKRLKRWVGKRPIRYKYFKFSYATSPKAAFEKECKNYHDFIDKGGLDNQEHPKRPARTTWSCPVCDIFD